MSDSLINIIKKISQGAEESSAPCNILYGKVTKVDPNIEITLEQKLVLTKEFLILTKNVIDYKTFITDGNNKKEIVIHNALKVNDTVILVQKRGGQDYIVVDKF